MWENQHCVFDACVCVVFTTVSSDEATQITSTSNRTMTPSTNLLFWAPHSPQLILYTHKHNAALTYRLLVFGLVMLCATDAQTKSEQQQWSKGPYRAGRIRNGHAGLCQPLSLHDAAPRVHHTVATCSLHRGLDDTRAYRNQGGFKKKTEI